MERTFREEKSTLEIRPICHKCDATISGHVFCSFLALVLMKELRERLERNGSDAEWGEVILDLDRLQEIELDQDGKLFVLCTKAKGLCGKVFQAAGVALPPAVRQVSAETAKRRGNAG